MRSAFVDRIYDAIGDEAAYAALPSMLSKLVDSSSSWFMLCTGGEPMIEASSNFDSSFLPAYEAYFHQHDLWLQKLNLYPLRKGVSFERLVPTATMRDSEFYNDLIRRHGDIMHGMGAIIPVADQLLVAAFQRTSKGQAFDADAEKRLQRVVPHLERLALSRRRLSAVAAHLALSDYAFQHSVDAIFLCDRRGAVLHLNDAAQTARAAFGVSRAADRLRMTHLREDGLLAQAIRDAAERDVSTVFFVERPDRLPWRITVDATLCDSPAMIVCIRDLDAALREKLDHAETLYGFTPSERALAESLLRDRSLEQHADLRGTSITTVRSQLRALLAKSGAKRQPALVAAILRC